LFFFTKGSGPPLSERDVFTSTITVFCFLPGLFFGGIFFFGVTVTELGEQGAMESTEPKIERESK